MMVKSNGGRSDREPNLPLLLVLASTFPRWANDTEPTFILELSRRLTKEFDVHVLAPGADGAAKSEQMLGITVHRFSYAPPSYQTLTYEGGIMSRLRQKPLRACLIPLFLCAEVLAIRRLLRRYNFAAIHCHWIIPQALALRLGTIGLRNRPPVLCTSHGTDLLGLPGRVMRTVKRWALANCSAMTVVSQAMLPEARRLVPGVPLDVIPMGTCLTQQFIIDRSKPREQNTILYVGRLVEKKGVGVLLEALAQVVRQHPEVKLWIAGKGPDEEVFKERSKQLDIAGHVILLGGVPHTDLPVLYQKAGVTVFPSTGQEGLGLVVVEALGCGCPVIVSDLPAIRDILPEEHMAIRVKPGDADALAEALSAALSDHDQTLSRVEVALGMIKGKFDWSSIANRYVNALQAIMERGK